jgi:hypothetical protein
MSGDSALVQDIASTESTRDGLDKIGQALAGGGGGVGYTLEDIGYHAGNPPNMNFLRDGGTALSWATASTQSRVYASLGSYALAVRVTGIDTQSRTAIVHLYGDNVSRISSAVRAGPTEYRSLDNSLAPFATPLTVNFSWNEVIHY